MATWSTVLSQIRTEIEEPSAGVWGDATLLAWWNEGARDYAQRTRLFSDEQYTTGIVGQSSYEIPDETIDIISVKWDDDDLTRTDYANLVALTDTGTPVNYALWGGITGSDDGIYLWPQPTEAKVITVLRYFMPAEVDDVADTIDFTARDIAAVKSYVKMRAYEMTGDTDIATYHRDSYERGVGDREFQTLRYETGVVREPSVVW